MSAYPWIDETGTPIWGTVYELILAGKPGVTAEFVERWDSEPRKQERSMKTSQHSSPSR